MVCHGEAASKPSPDGVKKAMAHLGVQNAVFIGDTPDDIRAAVGAGIVGLGVPAPSSDHAASSDVLRQCGANQVLSIGLHEFGGFLESIGKAL
jgi:phosphoglycolate phosphatase-like HAD superfamily hydrolase